MSLLVGHYIPTSGRMDGRTHATIESLHRNLKDTEALCRVLRDFVGIHMKYARVHISGSHISPSVMKMMMMMLMMKMMMMMMLGYYVHHFIFRISWFFACV